MQDSSRPDPNDEQGVNCDVPYSSIFGWKRELVFHPSTEHKLEALSQEQVNFYNENGYLKPLPALGPEEVAKWQDLWASMREAEGVGPLEVNGDP